MSEPTRNQLYHMILADIAMAMAVRTLNAGEARNTGGYHPGCIRDHWLAEARDKHLRQRVLSLANAGMGSLAGMDGAALLDQANRFGVPIDAAQAADIAQHFSDKRDAVLTYKR